MPKVSVIIPVYNVEKYLARCLNSIINQTLSDIEIICVNDGSTDSSLEILNQYSKNDTRIKVISQENKGISVARNIGIENSTGEYLSFIDSDDWVAIDFLEKLYNAAIANDADIAVSEILYHRKDKTTFILKFKKEEVTADYIKKLELCDVPTYGYVWNKIYRRTLNSDKIKFAEGRIYEDIMVTPVILYYSDKLVCVPGAIYNYFRHKNTTVKNKNKKSKQDFLFAQNTINDFYKEHGVDITNIGTKVKKYKLCGITVFKIIARREYTKYILFNFINWSRKKRCE